MAVYSYAEQFERELQQKYSRELISYDLTQSNPSISLLMPRLLNYQEWH